MSMFDSILKSFNIPEKVYQMFDKFLTKKQQEHSTGNLGIYFKKEAGNVKAWLNINGVWQEISKEEIIKELI